MKLDAPILIRMCPQCSGEMKYSCNYTRKRADAKAALCKSCANSKQNNPMFGRRGANNPLFGIRPKSNWMGRKHSFETKQKLSTIARGRPASFKGRHHTEKTKQILSEIAKNRPAHIIEKYRIQRVKFIEAHGGNKSFNPIACAAFDALNTRFEWNGIHAKNGGEKILSGYYLDYFNEPEKICIEWDEVGHFSQKRKIRDEKKHKRLVDVLGYEWCVVRWSQKDKAWRDDFITPFRHKRLDEIAETLKNTIP